MTAIELAMRRPVSRYGRAVGSVSTRKVCSPDAPAERSTSRCTGRVCRNPRSTFTKTGTKAAIAATYCRPNWLDAPNIVLRIGVIATIGTTAIAATRGASIPSTGPKVAARAASTIATTAPTARPTRALVAVMPMSSRMMS